MHLLTPPSSISNLSDNLLIYSSGTIAIISISVEKLSFVVCLRWIYAIDELTKILMNS